MTYPDVIAKDTGISFQDLGGGGNGGQIWGSFVKSAISTAVEQ